MKTGRNTKKPLAQLSVPLNVRPQIPLLDYNKPRTRLIVLKTMITKPNMPMKNGLILKLIPNEFTPSLYFGNFW
jgi:hypothetical protein